MILSFEVVQSCLMVLSAFMIRFIDLYTILCVDSLTISGTLAKYSSLRSDDSILFIGSLWDHDISYIMVR
jgi:hypothetical protein